VRHLYTMKDAAAGLQHPAAVEAEGLHGRPQSLDDRGIGVVSVQGVTGRRRQLPGGQQPGQVLAGPGVVRPVRVEDLGDCSPPGPARQDALLLGGGGPVVPLDRAEDGQRGEVRADARRRTGRRQVVLTGRAEPRR